MICVTIASLVTDVSATILTCLYSPSKRNKITADFPIRAGGTLNLRQSVVDNGDIQDTDEGAKDGSHQHPPLIVAPETSGWASHPCSRHMKMDTHACFLSPVRTPPNQGSRSKSERVNEAKGIFRIMSL